jgi:glycosyltransferase involved in cell wall biosynthesis
MERTPPLLESRRQDIEIMPSSSPRLPSLAVIGPLVGKNEGLIPTQGEFLACKFREAGHAVAEASSAHGRLSRLLDVVFTILRARRTDIQCLQVYGERSFLVEDVASLLGHICGQRVVMILRGGTLPTFMDRFPHWSQRVLSRADALVTPSSYMRREVGTRGFKAEIIPNVIDISKYPYRERHEVAPRLLWMRSFYSYYNPLMAIRVLGRVKEIHPEATLVMAGPDKGELPSVRAFVHEQGLASAVRFAGFLDAGAKTREFRAADVYLNTNTLDNMPVSVLEAAAMGLPVLATDVGGLRAFLSDGETALLLPSDDHKAMADGVLRLIREPALAHALSVNGRRLAEQCSWEVVGPAFERLFASLMTARPARGG